MNQPVNLIGLYAKLQIAAERCHAQGIPVPLNITRNIQAIEARAQTLLPPEAVQSALHHVSAEKNRLLEEESVAVRHAEAKREATVKQQFLDKLTAGFAGKKSLTEEEFDDLRKGKFKHRREMTASEVDDYFRSATRDLDPHGKGWSKAQYTRHMNLLADSTPEKFNEYSKAFNTSPAKLRAAVEEWKGERDKFEVEERLSNRDRGITFRKNKEIVPDVDPRDEIRAEVAHNLMMDIARRGDTKAVGQLEDDVPDFILEDQHLRGDIGRAVQEVEAREANNEEVYGG